MRLLSSSQLPNSNRRPHRPALFLVAGLFLLSFSCTAQDSGPSNIGDAGTSDSETEEFEKPEATLEQRDNILDGLRDEGSENADTSTSESFRPAHHMSPARGAGEMWLYEGEKSIFRYGLAQHGDFEPMTYRVFVLVNYEPVLFGVVDVDDDPGDQDPFPTDDELLELDMRVDSHLFDIDEGEKRGMAIVVDDEHLEQGHANEVRILLIEDFGDSNDDSYSNFAYTRTVGGIVYYEGYEPIDFPLIDDIERATPPETENKDWMLWLHGNYVEPVEGDMSFMDDWEYGGEEFISDLPAPISVDTLSPQIRTWITGQYPGESSTEFAILYRFDTQEFVALGKVTDLIYRDQNTPEEGIVQFDAPIDISADDNTSLIVMTLSGWFDHESDPEMYYGRDSASSNMIWLQYDD